jgi:hypothetical protein
MGYYIPCNKTSMRPKISILLKHRNPTFKQKGKNSLPVILMLERAKSTTVTEASLSGHSAMSDQLGHSGSPGFIKGSRMSHIYIGERYLLIF